MSGEYRRRGWEELACQMGSKQHGGGGGTVRRERQARPQSERANEGWWVVLGFKKGRQEYAKGGGGSQGTGASDGLLGRSSMPRRRVGLGRDSAQPEGAGYLGLWCK